MQRRRTQIIIIGAGPSGLCLALLLQRHGIEALVLEKHTQAHVESRVRAGVLERGTVAFLSRLGAGERLQRECMRHTGVQLAIEGEAFRIAFDRLVPGGELTIYGQSEITKDLNAATSARGIEIIYEAEDVKLTDVAHAPAVSFMSNEQHHTVTADFVVGCDGFHGISKASVPQSAATVYEHAYPFSWLGVLAEAAPCADEIIYAKHTRGFALASMRSPQISRYYIQVPQNTNISQFGLNQFWDELRSRLGDSGSKVTEGRALEVSLTPIRSYAIEPMRFGKLYLAGDAAHIVPPTGAKGLNLALNDVSLLAEAFADHYRKNTQTGLDTYAQRALTRVWQAQRFSWWLTELMHNVDTRDAFSERVWKAELEKLRYSQSAQKNFAENYTGL